MLILLAAAGIAFILCILYVANHYANAPKKVSVSAPLDMVKLKRFFYLNRCLRNGLPVSAEEFESLNNDQRRHAAGLYIFQKELWQQLVNEADDQIDQELKQKEQLVQDEHQIKLMMEAIRRSRLGVDPNQRSK